MVVRPISFGMPAPVPMPPVQTPIPIQAKLSRVSWAPQFQNLSGLESNEELARSLLEQAGSTAPAQGGLGEGLGRLAFGALGGYQLGKSRKKTEEGRRTNIDELINSGSLENPDMASLAALAGSGDKNLQALFPIMAGRLPKVQEPLRGSDRFITTPRGVMDVGAAGDNANLSIPFEQLPEAPKLDLRQSQDLALAKAQHASDLSVEDRIRIAQASRNPPITPETNLNSFPDAPYAPNPYKVLRPQAAEQMYRAQQGAYQKLQQENLDATAKARAGIQDASQFMQLNKQHPGSLAERAPWFLGGSAARGITGMFSDPAQNMDAIQNRLAPLMRAPGSGSISNYDAQQFMSATLGRDKSLAANNNIATGLKTRFQNEIDRSNFQDKYFAIHGHMNGMDRTWQQYLNDNPIFDPDKPGTFDLNKDRQGWEQYFSNTSGGMGKAPPQSQAPRSEQGSKPIGKSQTLKRKSGATAIVTEIP